MNGTVLLPALIAGAFSVSAYAAEATCPWKSHATYCTPCSKKIVEVYGKEYCKEDRMIKQHPEVFSRKGPTLTVRASSGAKKTFIDKSDPEAPTSRGIPSYLLDGYFSEIGYASLYVSYYEGSSYMFVNLNTGKSIDLHGAPTLSPDGRYVVVSYEDVTFGIGTMLAVYAVRPDRLIKEFDAADTNFGHGLEKITAKFGIWGPHSIQWISDTEFSFAVEVANCQIDQCGEGKPPPTFSLSKRRIGGKVQWWLK